jgi:hypothetical protein
MTTSEEDFQKLLAQRADAPAGGFADDAASRDYFGRYFVRFDEQDRPCWSADEFISRFPVLNIPEAERHRDFIIENNKDGIPEGAGPRGFPRNKFECRMLRWPYPDAVEEMQKARPLPADQAEGQIKSMIHREWQKNGLDGFQVPRQMIPDGTASLTEDGKHYVSYYGLIPIAA